MVKRRLSAEERRLWAHVAASVRPLKDKAVPVIEAETSGQEEKALKPVSAAAKKSPTPIAKRHAPNKEPAPPPEIDQRGDKRTRRGQVDIDGTLDLHGMTQIQARDALRGFLFHLHAHGARCALVITGKGDPRQRAYGHDAPGVLRRRFPDWLNEPDIRPVVSQYANANRRHGGDGAFYVFLKRVS